MRSRAAFLAAVVLTGFAACDSDAPSVDAAAPDAAAPDAGTPAWPDLRFKGVGAFPAYTSRLSTNVTFALGGGGMKIAYSPPDRHAYTPLQLDASSVSAGGNYSWKVVDFAPSDDSEALSALAQTGAIDSFDDDVTQVIDAQQVITSLDLKPEAYALVAVATASGTPAYDFARRGPVPRDELDGLAAREGEAARVVTALSARAGRLEVISYGRHGDAQTFETQVVDASLATLEARAGELSQAGFTITAFGQSGADAFVLVGTRVKGQSVPRELFTETADQGPSLTTAIVDHGLAQGYAIVGLVFAASGSKVIGQR